MRAMRGDINDEYDSSDTMRDERQIRFDRYQRMTNKKDYTRENKEKGGKMAKESAGQDWTLESPKPPQ